MFILFLFSWKKSFLNAMKSQRAQLPGHLSKNEKGTLRQLGLESEVYNFNIRKLANPALRKTAATKHCTSALHTHRCTPELHTHRCTSPLPSITAHRRCTPLPHTTATRQCYTYDWSMGRPLEKLEGCVAGRNLLNRTKTGRRMGVLSHPAPKC